MTVYIAWCNDMILGIYKTQARAELCCDSYRRTNTWMDWKQIPGNPVRWSASGVARLGVEPQEVIE